LEDLSLKKVFSERRGRFPNTEGLILFPLEIRRELLSSTWELYRGPPSITQGKTSSLYLFPKGRSGVQLPLEKVKKSRFVRPSIRGRSYASP